MKHRQLFKVIFYAYVVLVLTHGLNYTVADFVLPEKFDLILKSIRDILLLALLMVGILDWKHELWIFFKKTWLPLIILFSAVSLSFLNNYQTSLGNIIGLRNDFYWLLCILIVYFAKKYRLTFNNLVKNLLIINIITAIIQFFLRSNLIWLENIGYGGDNISPLQTIGENITWYRAFGLLSGPNQFGAVMALSSLAYFLFLLYEKQLDKTKVIQCLFLLVGVVLSFSRSAWMAVFIGFAFGLYYYRRTWLSLFLIVSFIVLLGVGFISPNTILHGGIVDNSLIGSDINRVDSYQKSFNLVLKNPLGYGAGSVGSTNFLESSRLNFIVENFYLQLLLNYGVLIFVAGLFLIGRFWKKIPPNTKILAISTVVLCSFLPILNDASVAFIFAYWIIYCNFKAHSKPKDNYQNL